MSEKIVLFDGNNIMHRAFHALPITMCSEDGTPTNALTGFLQTLLLSLEQEKPRYAAVAFDLHGPTFRHKAYDGYKANRPQTPVELRTQFDIIKKLLSEMHIAVETLEEYEADDIMGTISRYCETLGMESVIVSGDKDTFQLIGNGTRLRYLSGKGDVERGDAQYLLNRFGLSANQITDLKGLMGDSSDNIPGVPGIGEKTAVKLLQKYGTLENALDSADTNEKGALREKLINGRNSALFSKKMATIDRNAPMALDLTKWEIGAVSEGKPRLKALGLNRAMAKVEELFPSGEEDAPTAPTYISEALSDCEQAKQWAKRHAKKGGTAAFAVTDVFSVADGECGAYLPLGGDLLSPGIEPKEAYQSFADFFANRDCVVLHDIKGVMTQGIEIQGSVFDSMLAAYCIDPTKKSFAPQDLAQSQTGDTLAARLLSLAKTQQARMEKDGVSFIYNEIELPLAKVLFDMEKTGFCVDSAALESLKGIYQEKINALLAKIRKVDDKVNVNSPKQLGELLFEKMGLPAQKKTSRGYSTDADTLEALVEKDATGIVEAVLEYRKYQKLQSTYVEALLRLKAQDGRVHTTFDQTATATGRISSNEPNLQNIPVRSELGKDIRKAFVPRKGWTLIDADYSQIELRVLAHLSGDAVMRDTFLKGQDIHARCAAEVNSVSLEDVTPLMRSQAKAVNFGIVYGISDFGLARNIGVSRGEAAAFIARYFERYPLIRAFMTDRVKEGKEKGYAETLFGRRRPLPELSSQNFNVRSFGERCAMNSPVQGTAADIIKIAMIRVVRALEEQHLQAKLLLQVHDELILEAPPEEAEQVKTLLRDAMEGASLLSVPLIAQMSQGNSWYECK